MNDVVVDVLNLEFDVSHEVHENEALAASLYIMILWKLILLMFAVFNTNKTRIPY